MSPKKSYSKLFVEASTFWSLTRGLLTPTKLGCMLHIQTCEKPPCCTQRELTLHRWFYAAGQSDGTAPNRSKNGAISCTGLLTASLFVLRAKGKPFSLTSGMVAVGSGPCDQFDH